MRQSKGFTIVELLVVLSIIALIMGVGLATMTHSGRQFSFQAVRGEMVSLVRYTRSNATIEKGVSVIVIDPIKKQIYTRSRRAAGLSPPLGTSGPGRPSSFARRARSHKSTKV